MSTIRGCRARHAEPSNGSVHVIILDRASWHGASGSIVYTADASVVGTIVHAGFNDGEGLLYAVGAAEIAQFLRSHAIKFAQR